MLEPADIDLVREYARSGSEEAFSSLVARHLNLVYSVALRLVRNPHQAEEISQAVFIILAKKAGSLSQRTVVPGWLYETARLTAANYLRTEIRRAEREQEAYMQSTLDEGQPDTWATVAPILDQAMAHLNAQERNALVLRFFQTKSFHEVSASLGTSEDAAKMRVNRAVEKLRKFFLRQGVALSAAAICGAVSAHSIQAAPVGLATAISAAALKGAGGTASTFTLIKTTLKIMAWTKAKTAIAIAAGTLLVVGTATVTVEQTMDRRDSVWQTRYLSGAMLEKVSPRVRIVPTKFPRSTGAVSSHDKIAGIGHSVESILLVAYDVASPSRMLLAGNLPEGKYDFIANLRQNSHAALQNELKRRFGLSARHELRPTDVLRLTVKTPGAGGLRPGTGNGSATTSAGKFSCENQPLFSLATTLENELNVPVVDETGLSGRFDIDLTWDQEGLLGPTNDALRQALAEQLGLELTPAKQSIDMLVVQQTN